MKHKDDEYASRNTNKFKDIEISIQCYISYESYSQI